MAKSKDKPFPQISDAKKRAFLVAYAKCGGVCKSAEAVGISDRTHRNWIHDDAEYKAAFEDAGEAYVQKLEAEADRRATEGVEEPVYQGGELVGTKLKFSDTLLIFRLKGLKPEKYRERIEHKGQVEHKLRVVEDGDWYANADRLSAQTNGAPNSSAHESGPVQSGGNGKTVGQNGHGPAGGS